MSGNMIFVIPVLVGLVTAAFGWRAVHKRLHRAYLIALSLALVASGGLYLAAIDASGWDGIAYAVPLIFGGLPTAAGLLVGGGIGIFTKPRFLVPS